MSTVCADKQGQQIEDFDFEKQVLKIYLEYFYGIEKSIKYYNFLRCNLSILADINKLKIYNQSVENDLKIVLKEKTIRPELKYIAEIFEVIISTSSPNIMEAVSSNFSDYLIGQLKILKEWLKESKNTKQQGIEVNKIVEKRL